MPVNIINTDLFAELRQNYGYYVDKTGFLEKFLDSPADANLFTRPRRFGKTLFMSMLGEFFDITKDSRALFAGLKVAENETLCREWMNQYPVISLTLRGIDTLTYSEAVNIIQIKISNICILHDDVLSNNRIGVRDKTVFQKLMNRETSESTLQSALLVLTRVLSQHYNKPVILLIDEYDAPVTKAAGRGYYDEMTVFMRGFLTDALKTNPCLKFGILTGVLRINQKCLFSALNNLACFDIAASSYSDVFGFTQAEVDKVLFDAGLVEERDKLREWYGGYRFGERSDIYCPCSIMQYLSVLEGNFQRDPEGYWEGAIGSALSKGFRDSIPVTVQDDMASLADGKSIPASINKDLYYTQVYSKKSSFWTWLCQTGYLAHSLDTAKCVVPPRPGQTVLAIPNREVREAFETDIKSWFENFVPEEDMLDDFFQPFWDGDATKFEQELHERLLLSSSVHDYRYREHFYHSFLLGIFMLLYSVTSNRGAGEGFFELIVQDTRDKRAAVIVVRRADSEKEFEAGVREALQQIEEPSTVQSLKAEATRESSTGAWRFSKSPGWWYAARRG